MTKQEFINDSKRKYSQCDESSILMYFLQAFDEVTPNNVIISESKDLKQFYNYCYDFAKTNQKNKTYLLIPDVLKTLVYDYFKFEISDAVNVLDVDLDSFL